MSRCLLSFLLAASTLASTASAQVAGRRPVAAGDVTGVELQLEGSLSVERGSTLRWAVVAYEVVGLDRLRPAPGAEIRLATSLRRRSDDDVGPLVVTADARGRAVIELPIPNDAPDSIGATLDVHARRGVTRRFELRVQTREPRQLVLFGAENAPAPGRLPVFGRLSTTAAGVADAEIKLVLNDGRGPLGAPARVRTDAAGLFSHEFRVPREAEGALRVEATGPSDGSDAERRPRAAWTATIAQPSEPPLVVAVRPMRSLVRSQERVEVEVLVRRADGRPVPETRLRIGGGPIPLLLEEEQRTRERFAVTDARGRARLTWEAPRVGGTHADQTITVQAGRAGIGRGVGQASVRVSDRRHASRLAVEGGVLVPGLSARAFVRVTTMDGLPVAAGVPVVVEGPRVGRAEGVTTEGGVVAVDLRVGAPRDGDRCGGLAATDVVVTVAGEASPPRCLPVDPDAAVRVRLSRGLLVAGETVQVSVERTSLARGMPVALVAMRRDPSGTLEPLATVVLEGREDAIPMTLPPTARGEVLVRARPLASPGDQEVRGGFAALYALGAAPATTTAEAVVEDASIVARVTGSEGLRLALAVPYGDDTRLRAQLEALAHGPFADLRGAPLTDATVAAMLAERTPMDVAAPAVLRGTTRASVEPAPEPNNPETHGLLRDPWRASARFVEGRLALLFRAIEARVNAAVPEQLDEVAVQRNGRYSFNRQLLASLADGSLGSEGATGLGGEPLTIEGLEALDRTFGYDAVARRITRERLFVLLLAMREFVQQNTLDLAWTRPGDPTLWMERLKNRHVAGRYVSAGMLVDGWGRPFRLVATARPRFAAVQPVVGYELVSAGPDGRYGNGDDLVDPTARVLPSGSLYGDAVGEDALVARLHGVELGRATLALAAGAFGAPRPHIAPPPDESRPQTALGELPPRFEADPHALALLRPTRPASSVVARGDLRLPVGREPRTWRLMVLSASATGELAFAADATRAGAPVLADLALPSRLRVNEPLAFPLHLTNVTEQEARYSLVASAEGIGVELPNEITLPAGETRSVNVALSAREEGRHAVVVEVKSGERTLQDARARVGVDGGGHPTRRRATGVAGDFEATIEIPGDASGTRSRLVIVGADALAADPDLDELRRDDPALVAWSDTMAGRSLEPSLRARLLRGVGPDGMVAGEEPALSTAAAVIALSALFDENGEPDAEARAARARVASRIGGLPPFHDTDGVAGRTRMMAASLAALATSGAVEPFRGSHDEVMHRPSSHDPVANAIRVWMPQLRRTLRERPADASLLARAAGALLLADARDGHGRAMYAKVRDSLASDGLVAGMERRSLADRLAGSLAFVLAAHQVGDVENAERVLHAVMRRSGSISGRGGELSFWWLACGAYGALGATPSSVQVDGREVALERGVATVDLELAAGRSRSVHVVSQGGAVMARVEAVFARPFDARREGRMELSIEGSVGRVGELAALELNVKSLSWHDAAVLEVQLPAGVEADERLLAALRANGVVRDAEAREPGFVRLTLVPLEPQQQVAIALPLRWRAAGRVRGLAVVGYSAATPERMTVLPARVLEVGAEQ
ncbi:MAG: hypothetical protein H6724_12135 [Sandaracinus sp.]|nr:hypothetical protein [Sandaracinus sp.]MCB9620184.1 hypothetical protein [Sandaracinus sp.]